MVRLVNHQSRRQIFLTTRDYVVRNLKQEFSRGEPPVKNISVGNIFTLLQQLQQIVKQKSFSRSNLSRQDYETFVPSHPVIERRQSFVVSPGGKEEGRVRGDIKRIAFQGEKRFIHCGFTNRENNSAQTRQRS